MVVSLIDYQCAISDLQLKRVYLTLQNPSTIQSKTELDRLLANAMVLDFGNCDDIGLHESWLACRVQSKEALNAWKRVAKLLKEITEEGITATNRQNGISAYYKTFRYTQGALKLQQEGVKIVSPQGINGPLIRLGKQI
jgi:hypothetical protein